jgi:ATP-dependent 26S proteasome regulatory subunit
MKAMAVLRKLAMSRTGRWVAIRIGDELEIIDLLGTAGNRWTRAGGDFDFVAKQLWVLDGRSLRRLNLDDLSVIEPHLVLPHSGSGLVVGHGPQAAEAVVVGDPTSLLVSVRSEAIIADPIDEVSGAERVVAVHGWRTLVSGADRLRALDRGGREAWRTTAPLGGEVLGAWFLFGGRAAAALIRGESGDAFRVVGPNGAAIHHIATATSASWCVAEQLGQAFIFDGDQEVTRVDLRYGKVVGTAAAPSAIVEMACDQDGKHVVLALGAGREGEVLHVVVSELFRPIRREPHGNGVSDLDLIGAGADRSVNGVGVRPEAEPGTESGVEASAEARTARIDAPILAPTLGQTVAPAEESQLPHGVTAVSEGRRRPISTDAAAGDAPITSPQQPKRVDVPDDLPLALGPPPPEPPVVRSGETSPYLTARAHLDAMLDLVSARVALAIADAWNSGRLSTPHGTKRPFELEVAALLGDSAGAAPQKVTTGKAEVDRRQREASERAAASAQRGIRLPFSELAREMRLSPVAAQLLLLSSAPSLRGEISRLYSVLSNDPNRPLVDRFLIEQIVGEQSSLRDQIARELAPDSRLVRHGLLVVGASASGSLFAPITVPDALLDRLRGLPIPRTDDVSTVRVADRSLDQIYIVSSVKRELVSHLAQTRPPQDPLRLVIRGRRGAGRHSVMAALAARVGREVIAIDTQRMPRMPREMVTVLRTALFRANVHGLIPMLSGLEAIEPTDADLREMVRQVLRTHPGPIIVRTSPESMLPMDAGFLTVTLPSLSEAQRADVWSGLCGAVGLVANFDHLASRYRIGPGVIERVASHVASRRALADDNTDQTLAIEEQVRQYVATRLDHVASRITRVAQWEDIALPDEMLDSLREFIGRARHRRTVFEKWGYETKMSSARGLTALFYGPPGTGKTMVAGVISTELGLDLYRVDLARVVSKWLGETEKNLAEVFDAAEDGQVLILFDEADSLFAKRTDVKTSNDRYANLEVNYLLQRLDTFEGVAILTSNLDGAIDPAFKRRLSLRLQFPFPDEDMRVRLWAAHVTPQIPTEGLFDFADLARRFPMSGGYIRNAAIRAAFLAAHEGQSLSQAYLLRAIQLEYREMGKLSTSTRIE